MHGTHACVQMYGGSLAYVQMYMCDICLYAGARVCVGHVPVCRYIHV